MKRFKAPMIEFVYFNKEDIITSSTCPKDCMCVGCPECEAGSYDCTPFDNCRPLYCPSYVNK